MGLGQVAVDVSLEGGAYCFDEGFGVEAGHGFHADEVSGGGHTGDLADEEGDAGFPVGVVGVQDVFCERQDGVGDDGPGGGGVAGDGVAEGGEVGLARRGGPEDFGVADDAFP